jgi:hypothetical protein
MVMYIPLAGGRLIHHRQKAVAVAFTATTTEVSKNGGGIGIIPQVLWRPRRWQQELARATALAPAPGRHQSDQTSLP